MMCILDATQSAQLWECISESRVRSAPLGWLQVTDVISTVGISNGGLRESLPWTSSGGHKCNRCKKLAFVWRQGQDSSRVRHMDATAEVVILSVFSFFGNRRGQPFAFKRENNSAARKPLAERGRPRTDKTNRTIQELAVFLSVSFIRFECLPPPLCLLPPMRAARSSGFPCRSSPCTASLHPQPETRNGNFNSALQALLSHLSWSCARCYIQSTGFVASFVFSIVTCYDGLHWLFWGSLPPTVFASLHPSPRTCDNTESKECTLHTSILPAAL